MLCQALILSCWIMREILGALGCSRVTKVGDYSITGFEASQYFPNQHGCTCANRLNINCWRGGCFSQESPWRVTAVGADSVTFQHCLACTVGTQSSPPFGALSWGQCLSVLDHFQGSQNPPTQVSSGLAGCNLPAPRRLLGAAWNSCCQLAPTGFYVREGRVFPYGFDGGAWFRSIGVIPPK